jgi:hypothetical protein
VDGLSWDDVLAICGPEARIHARLARAAYARLVDPSIPGALRVGRFEVTSVGARSSLLRTYSGLDPLDVPRPLLDVLRHFDGRPTEDAIRAIAEQHGLALGPAQLRELVDFRILVPVEAEPAA